MPYFLKLLRLLDQSYNTNEKYFYIEYSNRIHEILYVLYDLLMIQKHEVVLSGKKKMVKIYLRYYKKLPRIVDKEIEPQYLILFERKPYKKIIYRPKNYKRHITYKNLKRNDRINVQHIIYTKKGLMLGTEAISHGIGGIIVSTVIIV